MEYGDPNLKYDLPPDLLTPERLEAAQLEQRILAQKVNSPYSNRTPHDIQRFNAGIIIEESEKLLAEGNLSEVGREIYAEALAEVGLYRHAATVTTDAAKKAHYEAIWHAITRPDDERCDCSRADFNGVKKNHLFAAADIWSIQHGKRMSIIKCNSCGHMNVRALPASIAQERDIRKKNIDAVRWNEAHPKEASRPLIR